MNRCKGVPQRIIVLTPTIDGRDGVSSFARSVVLALATARSDVGPPIEVWSLYDRPSQFRGNDRVIYRSAAGSRLRLGYWGLGGALASRAGTLVVAVHIGVAPVALPLVARGARMVLCLLGIEAWRPLRRAQTAVFQRAHVVMAISGTTRDRFREANPALAQREIDVCHPGMLEPLVETGAEPVRPPFALIVGRMAVTERYKGHDLLLDLWPQICAEAGDVALWVAGDGDDRARLETRAAALGLERNIRFLGAVSDGRLAELYRDCAFFVMPSRDEGFGLVFLEAMRWGKACIGGRGAAEEIIADGVTGLVVDPRDPEQVAHAIIRLFSDPAECVRLGAAGARRFREEFTAQQFQRRFLNLLNATRDVGAVGRMCSAEVRG